jgi:drug/metabolite transporter (DMT)-like permease
MEELYASMALVEKRFRIVAVLIFVQVCFGLGYVTSKVALSVFPALLFASGVDFVSGALLWIVVSLRRGIFFFPKSQDWLPLFLCSFFGIFLGHASYFKGLAWTTAFNASLMRTLVPLVTLLIAVMQGKERLYCKRLWGFFLAFFGVFLLQRNVSFSNQTFLGDALIFLSCIGTSLYLIFSKSFVKERDAVGLMTWIFLLGGAQLAVFCWIQGVDQPVDWDLFWTYRIFGSFCFAVFGVNFCGYLLNFWILGYFSSSSVALFKYLQPLIVGIFAFFFFKESVSLRSLLSWSCILLGMWGASSPQKKRRKKVLSLFRGSERRG